MKPGLNPQALSDKLSEIELDFANQEMEEPLFVVRFRRSDGTEGLLATREDLTAQACTHPGMSLEGDTEPMAPWAEPCKRRDDALTPEQLDRLARRKPARLVRSPVRQERNYWPAVVLGLVLLGAAFWAHAAGLVWVNIGDNLQRSGPDKFGTICYRSSQALSCVKTGYFVDGAP